MTRHYLATPAGLRDGLATAGAGIALFAPDGAQLDAFAWGQASPSHPFVEGSVAAAIPDSLAAQRAADGQDTDDNAADFVVGAKTPAASNKLR